MRRLPAGYQNKQLRALAQQGLLDKRMVAVILHHPDEVGKKYRLATKKDQEAYEKAAAQLHEVTANWSRFESPLPDETINPKRPSPNARGLSSVTRYGFEHFVELYNERQQLCLITLMRALEEAKDRVQKDVAQLISATSEKDVDTSKLAEAVAGYLAIVVSRMVDRLTMFSRWHNSGEKLEAALSSDKKLPMIWDFAEVNPFSGSGGSWRSQLDWVLRYIDANSWPAKADVSISQGSATALPYQANSFDAVLTDPPYYDNYPYSDLSDYYYVWMKRMLGDQYPKLFSTPLTPKTEEAVLLTSRHPDLQEAKSFFEGQLEKAFSEMHRVLKPEGVAVIVYAHTTTEGWETMLGALCEAGFAVTGSWPIQTEMKNKIKAAHSAFLGSSIYMVCRKTERKPLGFWNDIQPQIRQRVEEKLEQFWKAGSVGGDFFISAIGPGMEAYSRYEAVETYDGREVTVGDLLQYIRQVATDFLVHRLLKDAGSGAVDKEAQFYLTYRWTFLNNRVEYDDARRIAAAEGVNIDRLAEGDSFIKKTRKYVYVRGPQKRGAIKNINNMVDAMHLACRMWEQGHREAVGQRLAEAGYNQSGAFWQLCQAVAECLPQGNKEKQLLEGLLMSKNKYQQAKAVSNGADSSGQISLDFEE